MGKKATTWVIGIVFAATVLLTFVQPSVIHQLVVWVSGAFAVLVALALFVVGNWPIQRDTVINIKNSTTDQYIIDRVTYGRRIGCTDDEIAKVLGLDIDVVRSIPR